MKKIEINIHYLFCCICIGGYGIALTLAQNIIAANHGGIILLDYTQYNELWFELITNSLFLLFYLIGFILFCKYYFTGESS